MKRSEINSIISKAIKFLKKHQFYLPKFAYWSLEDWKGKGEEINEIIDVKLGWDITDYGRGDFYKMGLIHFTIRNGNPNTINQGGKNYCEKIMIMEQVQQIPMHFHSNKMEDIINRGGCSLMVQLYNSNNENKFSNSEITVSIDGELTNLAAGAIIELSPGESITIPPRLFHKFWVKKKNGKILIGEVSRVNDDIGDNFFVEKVSRFPDIEEDTAPKYLLCSDYKKFLNR
ncbi:MAG: D-lyxose/D-mannose family sugar isomerase [Candidatus Lokiarchaeota archaeon]|nr:D-lyxose/D-mannose family sugar isomerase [Candidatus Lokiarchaeota archaeon]